MRGPSRTTTRTTTGDEDSLAVPLQIGLPAVFNSSGNLAGVPPEGVGARLDEQRETILRALKNAGPGAGLSFSWHITKE